MPFRIPAIAIVALAFSVSAGPYAPPAGDMGSTAISADDPAIVAWADNWAAYLPGGEVAPEWQTPEKALGRAHTENEDVFDVVALGRGGSIVLEFSRPLTDGEGADFAVFENAQNGGFLELAFVEVSSNGTDFFRFPNDSLTPGPVGAFAANMEASEIDGFAGKYRSGYGTPFDLAEIPDRPGFDRNAVHFVRLIDVTGDGTVVDSSGDVVFDPYPTVGSAGFDLDGVGALHLAVKPPLRITRFEVEGAVYELDWIGVAWEDYVVEGSASLASWVEFAAQAGQSGTDTVQLTGLDAEYRFFRVRSVPPSGRSEKGS